MHTQAILAHPDIQVIKERFHAKHLQGEGCWEWTAARQQKGYGRFGAAGKTFAAHRLAFLFANGYLDDDQQCLHSCDNPSCVNPKHISQGTALDNTTDMLDKRREASGEKNGHAVLTEADVAAIKQDPRVQRVIAEEYDIDQSTVSLIKSGKRWKRTNE